MLTDLIDAVKKLVGEWADLKRPATVEVVHATSHPRAGQVAGHFVLSADEDGKSAYVWQRFDDGTVQQHAAQAELVVAHEFTDLASLVRYLDQKVVDVGRARAKVFIGASPNSIDAVVTALLEEEHPERGALTLRFQRHPEWQRWMSRLCGGQHVDLTHEQLADLMLDGKEALGQPVLASQIAVFRAVKTFVHESDFDTGATTGFRAEFAGKSGNGTGKVDVPREFDATFPAFVGAWEPGAEPKHTAIFRLRVIPPKGADTLPLFRLTCSNAPDYDQEARRALREAVAAQLVNHDVYAANPKVQRFVKGS